MMRVALMPRVSSERQATEDRHSMSVQRELMLRICAQRGWSVVREFPIPGESASRAYLSERPQFAEAVRFALSGQCDVLMTYDPNRFARHEAVAHPLLRDLSAAKCRLFFAVGEWFADDRPEMFTLSIMIGSRQTAEQGAKIGAAYGRRHELGLETGAVPFGYRREVGSATSAPARVVPAEAAAVRWAFERRSLGMGYAEIGREFTRRGLSPRSRAGVGWTVPAVQSICESLFYAGWVTWRGHRSMGGHEAVVSMALWQAAQDAVRARSQVAVREDRPLLAGLASCACCGGPAWVHHGRGRSYYSCAARRRAAACDWAGRMTHSGPIDEVVEGLVLSMAAPSRWFEDALVLANGSPEVAGPSIEERRAKLEAKRSRLSVAWSEGAIDEASWRREVGLVAAELSGLEGSVGGRAAVPVVAAGRMAGIGEAWREVSLRARGELCRVLFAGARVDVGEGRLVGVAAREGFGELFELRALWKVMCDGGPDRTPPLLTHPTAPRWYSPEELTA